MNIFSIVQAGMTLILSVAPWFLPDCAWYFKVIILLCVLLCSVCVSYIRLAINLKSVSRQLNELDLRHTALASQYDEKREQENRYRLFSQQMSIMFQVAMANTNHAKIFGLYKAYLMLEKDLIGGISDEQHIQNH